VYTTIRASASTLLKKSWRCIENLSGFDDPFGNHLFGLESRVQCLEAEVKALRGLLGKSGVETGEA